MEAQEKKLNLIIGLVTLVLDPWPSLGMSKSFILCPRMGLANLTSDNKQFIGQSTTMKAT